MSNVDFGRYKRIVRYFWDPEPKNDDCFDAPIWCLGKRYGAKYIFDSNDATSTSRDMVVKNKDRSDCFKDDLNQATVKVGFAAASGGPTDPDQPQTYIDETDRIWPTEFLDDFESRFRFTYRSAFPTISNSSDPSISNPIALSARLRNQLVDKSGFTSDTGWGCMIRSGQSLLANAIGILRLGRDWRRGNHKDEERHLIALFADNENAPFSIHNFVQHGASACGKRPGEWFGPSATARCIKALLAEYTDTGLKVHFTGDGADVYKDEFLRTATAENGSFIPTLLLIGIRLGIDRVTPVYWEAVKTSLHLSQSVGIAGGRPSSSHYFVATQRNNLFYLDPHQTHPVLPLHSNIAAYTAEDVDSCHTRRLRRLSIEEMDPSMLIGFLIKSFEDWREWRTAVSDVAGKPLVHVADIGPVPNDHYDERRNAIDEVETIDDEYESDGESCEYLR